MSVRVGSRLGVYEVLAPLGAGGMGEVYRARDTKLNREVAIKILPATFATDADRIARFNREAQTLAALNHPHIAQIYGLEQSDGTSALVMELVEGEDLSKRIERGPLPLEEALPIARQIAEALEAAHEQGIIHRDLKPANIKVRSDGTVKVLDFGLAKAVDPTPTNADAHASATITSPALTMQGMLLGTAAVLVSTTGGQDPVWSLTSNELFYWTGPSSVSSQPGHLFSVTYKREGDMLIFDQPRMISKERIGMRPRQRDFAMHPDGTRFLVAPAPAEASATSLLKHVVIVSNFFEELNRLLPRN